MSLTWYAPIFLLFLAYACCGQRQWVAATVVSSFFQAASPVLLLSAGRNIGVQAVYLLLPVGILQFFIQSFQPRAALGARLRLNSSHLFLLGLTAISVIGALLLPRVFSGLAHVMPPRGGHRVMLHPTSGNLIQAFYVACNFTLCILVAVSIYRKSITMTQGIHYFAIGTTVAVCLGLYQVTCDFVHLPWPDAVINSNLGADQQFGQTALGIRRMSATFLEPSVMAMHFLGMFALFALGMRYRAIGVAVLFCLLISTSGTAYAGLVCISILSIVVQIWRYGLGMRTTMAISIVIGLVAAALIINSMGTHDWTQSNIVTEKLATHSGKTRLAEDAVALNTVIESWGFGVGVGSTRASSFFTTFVACTGIIGLICLFGFFGALILQSLKSDIKELRALGFGLMALFIGWLISVPDLAMPMVWVISGMMTGVLSQFPERRPALQIAEPSSMLTTAT